MKHSPTPVGRARRAAAAALVVLTGAAPIASAAERDDDVAFAVGLSQRGYPTLAQAEIDRMLVNATPERREKAEYTRCELLRRAALLAASRADSEPGEVRTRFSEARQAYESFLKNYRSGPRVADAEFSNANLLKDFGYFLNKRKADFPDQAQVQKEAESAFDESIRLLAIVRDREDRKVLAAREKDEEDDGALQLRNVAWYYLAVATHERALLYPVGDVLRIQGLTRVIDEILYPFLEEEDGNIPGYHAALWLGRSHWERARQKTGWDADDLKSAREWFSVTVDACDIEGAASWPALVNVILEGAREYGRMCNEVGSVGSENFPQIFVQRMDSLEMKLPALRTTRPGLEALIEKARAQASIGLHVQAVQAVNAVSEAAGKLDPTVGRAVDFQARQALNDLISSIPPDSEVTLSPAILVEAGEGSIQAGNPRRAIRALQRVLVTVEQEKDAARRKALLDEYHTRTWTTLAYCYLELERYREMFIAADQPVQRYLRDRRTDEDQDVGTCVKLRLQALKYLAQSGKDEGARAEADAALKFSTEKFPWIEGSNINYEQAVTEMEKARRHLVAGEKEESAAAYARAVELLGRLTEKEALYLKAQSRIGECLVLAQRYEDARKQLEGFLAKNAAYFNDPNTPPPRRQPQGWAIFWLANAYAELKNPARVVDVLADFEKKFEGASLDNSIARVRYLRVQALVAANRLPAAEAEVAALRSTDPGSPWTSPSALAVANALYNAQKTLRATDALGAKDMLGRAVDLYDFWIAAADAPDVDARLFVGKMNQEVGRIDRAREEFEKALEMVTGDRAESIRVTLVSLLISKEEYLKAKDELEVLFVKPQTDEQRLLAFCEALATRHPTVDVGVHRTSVIAALKAAVERAAVHPAGAAPKAAALRTLDAADDNLEKVCKNLVETYRSAGPDALTALASGCAISTLATTNALPAAVRKETFELVKRTPDMLDTLSSCHEALVKDSRSAITAINLLQMLIDSAPVSDEEVKPAGARHSARWFEWRIRLMRVYYRFGEINKQDRALETVCALYKSMTTLNELELAESVRPGSRREIEELKDQVEAALRALGKSGGCQ